MSHKLSVPLACLVVSFGMAPFASAGAVNGSDRKSQLLAALSAEPEDQAGEAIDLYLMQIRALQELAVLAPKDASVREALIRFVVQVKEKDAERTLFAAQSLASAGPVAIPEILRQLQDTNIPPHVVDSLALALARIESPCPEAIPILRRRLVADRSRPKNMIWTRIALARLGDRSPENLFVIRESLASSGGFAPTCRAITFCRRLDWAPAELVNILHREVRSDMRHSVLLAAMALAQGGASDKEARAAVLQAFEAALKSDDAHILGLGCAAAHVDPQRRGDYVRRSLKSVREHPNDELLLDTLVAIRLFMADSTFHTDVAEGLKSPDGQVTRNACYLAVGIGLPAQVAAADLRKGLESRDGDVRRAAALLAAFSLPSSECTLLETALEKETAPYLKDAFGLALRMMRMDVRADHKDQKQKVRLP